MKALFYNRYIFNTAKLIIGGYLKKKFNFKYEKCIPKSEKFIVLSNHTTNYDPLMVGMSFDRLLFYVSSDHIFRWGALSKLIKVLVDPIPRIKGKMEIQTAKDIIKRIKQGQDVCIFAEGNRTFIGETVEIPESTGKLVKLSGAGLITYRINGGYFSNPRWGESLRLGSMSGEMVAEYTSGQLKAMSVDEINEVIKRDLYLDAYQEQEKNPIPYVGNKLAEHLEIALFICPKCGKMDSLQSHEDEFNCSCGMCLKYTPYGKLLSISDYQLPFDTILEWGKWQEKELQVIAKKYENGMGNEPLTYDIQQSLWMVQRATRSKLLSKGKLALYKDRLDFLGNDGKCYTFTFEDIADMAIYSRMVLIFSMNDQVSYEIKSEIPRSALKYLELYRLFRGGASVSYKRKEQA